MREKKNKIDLQEMNSQPLTTLADVLGIDMPVTAETRGAEQEQTAEHPSDVLSRSSVRLTRETKGRAGKVMTKMTGLPADEAEVLALVRLIKRELGCGASVEGNAVLFQGDQRERLATFLKNQSFVKVKIG